LRDILRDRLLYLMILPAAVYFVVFHYLPMYGIQLAFKDFRIMEGITGSPWVGFKHFVRFLSDYQFRTVLTNTVLLSLEVLVFTAIPPVLLALAIHKVRFSPLRRFTQSVTFMPHFISVVVMAGMVFVFCSPRSGLVNHLIRLLGGEAIFFMARPEWFRPLYILTEIYQHAGFFAIIYLATLTNINPEQIEAAVVDGANKMQIMRFIEIPAIIPTFIVLFILNSGRIMSIGFEKIYALQTVLNLDASETIPTFVYKVGLQQARYSYATAVSLFNSLINLVLLLSVNRIARRLGSRGLW